MWDGDGMRIALYTLALDLMSGKESAIAELVRRSRHDWTVLTSRFDPAATFPELSELGVVDLRHGWYARHAAGRRGIVADACLHLPRTRLPLDGYDALYVVSAGLDHLVGLANRGTPQASMCLTPLRLAYDPEMRSHYRGSRDFGPAKRAGAATFRVMDARAWNRFAGILCISETVRERLLAPGRVDSARAEVVYPGVDAEAVAPSLREGDYFLVPGRLNWTKRIEIAIDAYRRYLELPGADAGMGLVVAGSPGAGDGGYVETLRRQAADEPRIRFVLAPSREELSELYDGCRAVLFTAVNEDFGIVPLEAMAHGKPAVCIDGGGPTETVIDGKTGFLCPDADGLARALGRLAADPGLARGLSEAARNRALEFDWRHFVARTDQRLEELLGRS